LPLPTAHFVKMIIMNAQLLRLRIIHEVCVLFIKMPYHELCVDSGVWGGGVVAVFLGDDNSSDLLIQLGM